MDGGPLDSGSKRKGGSVDGGCVVEGVPGCESDVL